MNKFGLILGSLALMSTTLVMATDYDCSATIPVNTKAWEGERWGMQVYVVEKGEAKRIEDVQTIDVGEGKTELTIPLHNCTDNTYYKISFGKVSHKSHGANEPWGFYYSQCYKKLKQKPEVDFKFEPLGNNKNPENTQFIYTGNPPSDCN